MTNDLNLYSSLMQVMAERYSCRDYDTRRAPGRDLIDAVLDAARIAPSACNRQPWRFMVVEGEHARSIISRAYDRAWIATAPAFIIALGDHSAAWHRPCDGKDHTDVDVSIAVEHICLAAASLGLGTCWVCNFDPKVIAGAFSLEPSLEPVAIIPIGYPAADAKVPAKSRKQLDEIVIKGDD